MCRIAVTESVIRDISREQNKDEYNKQSKSDDTTNKLTG